MNWDDLLILDDEDMIFAFHSKYLEIGCPGTEWKGKCSHGEMECAARGRCYIIHTIQH